MKKLQYIVLVLMFTYVSAALNSGCETSITEIVPYSGYWKFTFTKENGTVLSNAILTIQDTGNFCGKFTVNGSGDEFYIQGDVNGDGQITGGFSTSCTASVNGNISGTFTDLMGAGYASGTFTDTLQNPSYKGTWQARRN